MQKEDCFFLGKIVKKYSFKGEVIVKLDTDEPWLYENMDAVFIDFGNSLVPFLIEKSFLQKGNRLRVKFEDVNNEKDADQILRSDVYLPLELLPKLSGKKFYYHEVIGYKVEDLNHGTVGIIKNFNDSTAQPLFEIINNDKEILIPITDDFIKEVDRENKIILVKTPDGLIDMYL